jgi:L-ascorbate metabolism protein UlaG (beta-lactamase superfamily)
MTDAPPRASKEPAQEILDRIQWLGHGSFRIQAPPLIYINPWRVASGPFLADAILVSHDHYDHCSPGDIAKLRGPETVILASEHAAAYLGADARVLRPWQSINIGDANIQAVPAYTPYRPTHLREAGGLGFVISVQRFDIYYAGDTGMIPEMDRIRADIVMLPINGRDTMTPEEAARVVNRMRPRIAIPYNWGSDTGASKGDALDFRRACDADIEVALMKQTV